MAKRGVAALVTDGVVRDIAGVLATGPAGVVPGHGGAGLGGGPHLRRLAGADRLRRRRGVPRRRDRGGRGRRGLHPGGVCSTTVLKEGLEQERLEAWIMTRGREGRAAARPLSAERRDEGALRGVQGEVLSGTPDLMPGRPRRQRLSTRTTAGHVLLPLQAALVLRHAVERLRWRSWLVGLVLCVDAGAPAGAAARDARARCCYVVFGLSPAPNWLLLPLEQRFPIWRDDGRPVAAIVVLGGAVETATDKARGLLALNEGGERMIAMADLARRYPGVPVVFTGGARLAGGHRCDRGRSRRRRISPSMASRRGGSCSSGARATRWRTPASRGRC